jgi:hypothetical protein
MFSFDRERAFDVAITQLFFEHTVLLARIRELVSNEHHLVDGMPLEAWASHKSYRPKDDVGTTSTGKSAAMIRTPQPPIRLCG